MSAGRFTPVAIWFLTRIVRPFTRVAFRPTIRGLENLPAEGPYLLVGNHSAGIGIAEILCLASLFAERFDNDHRLAAFVHPINDKIPPLGWVQRQLGSIPSTYEAAERALADGLGILMLPGGDHETLRPFWQANRVDFGGRRGFLRIARKANVPIVPMGIRGSHWTAPMLLRSRALAWLLLVPRLVGFKRWGVSLLGLLGASALLLVPVAWPIRMGLVWLWLVSPATFMPIIPATVRIRIGKPIRPGSLFTASDEGLQLALASVQGAVQGLVDGQE